MMITLSTTKALVCRIIFLPIILPFLLMKVENKASVVHDKIIAALKEERLKAGLSHEKLAELAKISRRAIGMIEAGERKPTLFTCLRICNALNIDFKDTI